MGQVKVLFTERNRTRFLPEHIAKDKNLQKLKGFVIMNNPQPVLLEVEAVAKVKETTKKKPVKSK